MIKKMLLALYLCLTSQAIFAQKFYVWEPSTVNYPKRTGFLEGEKINLIITDGRAIPSNSKVKFSSEELIANIANIVTSAYPSANIALLPSLAYYKKAEENIITIKIAINAYQAGFGSDIKIAIGNIGGAFSYGILPEGKWNGITAYNVEVINNKKEPTIRNKQDFNSIASQPNLFGYSSAKKCLNQTFNDTNQKTLSFIDSCLME